MSIVARRYAQALMNLAVREGQVEPVSAALNDLGGALAASPELQAFLTEPRVGPAQKAAVVAELLERSEVPPLVATFVRFLTHKRRVELLDDIRSEFHDLADARMGRANAVVTVAAALTGAQEEALRARLSKLSGKEVKLEVQVDPHLLGGVMARIGSTVWDGSLRNQLNQIQQSLTQG